MYPKARDRGADITANVTRRNQGSFYCGEALIYNVIMEGTDMNDNMDYERRKLQLENLKRPEWALIIQYENLL